MTDIRLVHMADIHLGYRGSISLVFGEGEQNAGRYVREVDIEQAVVQLTKATRNAQLPVDVVVIAGDLFHYSTPLPRAIAWAARMVNVLISAGIDIVIVDGNHETSSSMHPGSPTVYLAELGAHVANGVDCLVIQGNRWHNPHLRGALAVHALPYRAVLEGQTAGVVPVNGCLNVLVTHGRVQGMEEVNTLGQATNHVPSAVISRGWDYVALGDCHFHHYQPIQHAPAYYAGSLEALNFGEATEYPPRRDDRNTMRGAIDVRLRPGAQAVLSTLENVGRRPVLRLKPIDAAKMEPEALMQALHDRLNAELPREALVRLDVTACPAGIYERLNHETIDQLRQQFRRCEIRFETVRRHEALQENYREWAIKISGCEGRSQSVENDRQRLDERVAEAEQHAEAAAEYAQLTVLIQQYQSRLSRLELVRDRYKALATQQADLGQANRDLQSYTTVNQQQQEVEKLSADTEAAWKALQVDPTEAEMRALQQSKAPIDLQEQYASEALRTLKDATQVSECPTCGHTLAAHSRKERVQHLNHWRIETLPGLRAQLATEKTVLAHRKAKWEQDKQIKFRTMQTRQLQNVLRRVDQRDALLQHRTEVRSKLREAQEAWAQLGEIQPYNSAEVTELEARVGALEARAKKIQEAANRYAQLPYWREQLGQKRHELRKLQRELTELTQAQAAVGYDSAAHQSTRDEYTTALQKASDAERNLTDANKELNGHQSATEHARETLKRAIQLRDRFADTVQAFQRDDSLLTFLSEFQEHFCTANVGRVVERATQLLRHAVTDQSILGIRFDQDSLVYLDASHHPRSVARLSGGEKALVGLCLRIALAEQAQAIARTGKVRFLVLDEVLSSLDDERREAVQRIFEDVLRRGIFERIIMITHLDTVKHGWRGATLEVHKVDSKTSKVIVGEPDARDMGLVELTGVK